MFPPTSCKNCSPNSLKSSTFSTEVSSLAEESAALGDAIFRMTSLLKSRLLHSLAITVPAVGFSSMLTALHTKLNNGALTRIM